MRTLSIIGQGQETLATGVWMGWRSAPAGGLLFDEEQFKTFRLDVAHDVRLENGDGTVTVISASLPQAYSDALAVRYQQASMSHGELVTDPDMVEEIAAFMADAMDLPAPR